MSRETHSASTSPSPGRRAMFQWRLLDAKFARNRRHYLYQGLMATVTILLVLLFLDSVQQTVLIASLGASSFIAFSAPHAHSSKPRYMLGGYIVGTVVGCGLSLTATWLAAATPLGAHTLQIVCGGVAAGFAFMAMVVTDTEHPPAAALALGYVLNQWDGLTVAVVFLGIAAIVIVKELAKQFMLDLV